MADYTIPLHELDGHGKDYTFSLAPAWLARQLRECGVRADGEIPGRAELQAQRNGREILVRGLVYAPLVAECVRCLEDFRFQVQAEWATLLTPAEDSPGVDLDELEVDASGPDREYYRGDKVELDELLREYLVLELPVDPLCDEACPGIEIPEHLKAPADLELSDEDRGEVDPRLAPLMKLAQGERDKE